jgi:hypothetical protein
MQFATVLRRNGKDRYYYHILIFDSLVTYPESNTDYRKNRMKYPLYILDLPFIDIIIFY